MIQKELVQINDGLIIEKKQKTKKSSKQRKDTETLNRLKKLTGTEVLKLVVFRLWLCLQQPLLLTPTKSNWPTTTFTFLFITRWYSRFVKQLDFGFHRYRTKRDTLKEDHPS